MSSSQLMDRGFLNSLVARTEYHLYDGTHVISCALTLGNGFVVVGQASCGKLTQFDPNVGMQISHANAMEKVAELVGFMTYELTAPPGHSLLARVDQQLNQPSSEGELDANPQQ